MSLTLSLQPTNHVFIDFPCQRSSSPTNVSTETIRHYGCRQVSLNSLPSSLSNKETHHSVSRLTEASIAPESFPSFAQGLSSASNDTIVTRPSNHELAPENLSDCNLQFYNSFQAALEPEPTIKCGIQLDSRLEGQSLPLIERNSMHADARSLSPPKKHTQEDKLPFKRWLDALRRRRRQLTLLSSVPHQCLPRESTEWEAGDGILKQNTQRLDRERNSASGSSAGFVREIKAMSVTLANTSICSKPWTTIKNPLTGAQGELLDQILNRRSHESFSNDRATDGLAWARSVQRRKILEELVESEESYIGDLKVLLNVYLTLLSPTSVVSNNTRMSIREILMEILQMHESVLNELHAAIPKCENSRSYAEDLPKFQRPRGHARWHSADNASISLREPQLFRKWRHSLEAARPIESYPTTTTADPKTAVKVAHIFEKFAGQLLAYEEYASKYDAMVRDLAPIYKDPSTSQPFDKGIEVLSKTLDSLDRQIQHSKKAMSFKDLLIKPIQRICKYHLFFGDLRNKTPVIDDPNAHAILEKLHLRFKEVNSVIDGATNDPTARLRMQKTSLLHGRLNVPSYLSPAMFYRSLGHLQLCGVLHVAYQSNTVVAGQYMLCALFKSYVIFATSWKDLSSFNVVASIPLSHVSLEEADNGRGLQCHTAPHMWKLVFESDHRLFELLLCACSQIEKDLWRRHLQDQISITSIATDLKSPSTADYCALLTLSIKELCFLHGQSNTITRCRSIHRAAAMGPKSQMTQVIIKNTQSLDQMSYNKTNTYLSLGRSQSIPGPPLVQVLNPRRSDRVNLELALADVWTREILPYPGMKPSESIIKASANQVIRKLSMASITHSISKRTSSLVNFNKPETRVFTPIDPSLSIARADDYFSTLDRCSKGPTLAQPANDMSHRIVNFHDDPQAFLPPDFELRGSRMARLPKPPAIVRSLLVEEQLARSTLSTEPSVLDLLPWVAASNSPRGKKAPIPARNGPLRARSPMCPTYPDATPSPPMDSMESLGKENSRQTKPRVPIPKQLRRLLK